MIELNIPGHGTLKLNNHIDQILAMQSTRLSPGDEAVQKANFVRQLGAERVAAIGQGTNDTQMLETTAPGIAVSSKKV